MEHLFKLKKDGKTVGYLKINPEGKWDELHPMEDKFMFRPIGEAHKGKWYCIGYKCLDFDSIHPFVTKDKNGKDVFEGDRVYVFDKVACKVIWSSTHRGWAVQLCENPEGLPMSMSSFYPKDIELIKDKDNECKS